MTVGTMNTTTWPTELGPCPLPGTASPSDIAAAAYVRRLAQHLRDLWMSGELSGGARPISGRLPEDDRPFTDFGQFGPGSVDLRVFDQDEWWVDRWGNPHRISDLTAEERREVTSICLRQAESWWPQAAFNQLCVLTYEQVGGLFDRGDALIAELQPQDWVRRSVLFRALT